MDDPDDPQPVCALCGSSPPPGSVAPPLTWTTAVEDGRDVVFCDRCSRRHLRAIEGKLDSAWW